MSLTLTHVRNTDGTYSLTFADDDGYRRDFTYPAYDGDGAVGEPYQDEDAYAAMMRDQSIALVRSDFEAVAAQEPEQVLAAAEPVDLS